MRVPRNARRRRRPSRGFTLIEILVVVAILGIIMNILLPMLVTQIQKARAQRIVTDFLFFREALYDYYVDHGEYPRDRGFGVAPPELAPYLGGRLQWRQSGGIWYDWENWVNRRGEARRPNTGVARGFSVRFSDRQAQLRPLLAKAYREGSVVIRNRKLIFVIEPAGEG